ncbi:MAG: EAL domain-containing protein [Actinobacteria bacterium]|nr:EAL domain-containing protein [Actinomycetota bacterium]
MDSPEREGAGSSSAALEGDEQKYALWRMIIRARYLAIAVLAVLSVPDAAGDRHLQVAAALIVVMLPYNGLCHWTLVRTGRLQPWIAFTDQLLVIAFASQAPELLPQGLLVALALNATAAVAFPKQIAYTSGVVGAAGLAGVAIAYGDARLAVLVGVFALTSGFAMTVVATIAKVERDVQDRYAELMSGIDVIVWEQLTRNPSTLYVNRRAEEILGYPASLWREPGFWRAHVHPDDADEAARQYRDAIRRGNNAELDYRMVGTDGRVLHMHDRMRVETDSLGGAVHVRGVMLDVTAEREATAQADQYVNLVESIRLALFVFGLRDLRDDETLELLAMNPEATMVTGLRAPSIGRPAADVLPFSDVDNVIANLADVVRSKEPFVMEEFQSGSGSGSGNQGSRVYSAYAFPLPGNAVGLSLHDVTERAMAAEVLRRQALHDGLTGLPNRTLLNERLRAALKHSHQTGEPVALLVMDLDQFKEVNDALGHDHGDRLLIEISRRLQRVLSGADTIARLGGDEFAVLLTTTADEVNSVAAAQLIRSELEHPFQLGGITLQTNASIGIALSPDHADDAESLAQKADVAMYTAKRGGAGYALYAPEHDQSSIRRLALLGELRRAISEDELVLHYQPVLDLTGGRVQGAEALLRWMHPEHGLMPPGEFIELAELSGMIGAVTRWVIDHALVQVREWTDSGLELRVAVNLSVRNLYDRELVAWLNNRLLERAVEASLLKLEITESELMDDPLLAMEVLGKMKSLGVSTSIDDFGTGYSSLAYLKNLPIDELKIDRSFVGHMVRDDNDLTIVRSTIDLSHNLGLDVVAEGVEDAQTLRLLRDLGCDRAQGYHISRPVPADDLTAWIASPDAQERVRADLG